MNITSGGYAGAVTITWTLQKLNGAWSDVSGATQATSTTLTGLVGLTIFASDDGTQGTNKNWGIHSTSAGTYRVKAVVETA